MQQDVALCATSAWLHRSWINAEKMQPGQQGSYRQEGKAVTGSSAVRLWQWCRAVMAVVQGS